MIVPMQKVAVLAHRPLRERVLDALQEAGMLQVRESDAPSTIDHSDVNFRVAELQYAITTLKDVAPKDVVAFAQRPSRPAEIIAASTETDVRGTVETLRDLERLDTDAAGVLQDARSRIAQLEPWERLRQALDAPRRTARTTAHFGMLPTENLAMLQETLSGRLPRTTLDVVGGDTQSAVVAHAWNGDEAEFEALATAAGWTSVDLPAHGGTPAQVLDAARTAVAEAEHGIAERARTRRDLSHRLPALMRVATYMQWLDAKQAVREQLSETSSMTTLLGWMPKEKVHELERTLQKLSPAIVILPVKADDGEDPPVLLRNKSFVTPFESVTTLYGLPMPHEMDPTPMLSPFFIVFFSLCLTDAGYGLVLFLIFSAVLFKTRKTVNEAPLLWLLWASGLVTFFVSIPFGGWFGLNPNLMPEFLTKPDPEGTGRLFIGQIWNLSAQSGITFLQNLALGLGLTHLFFGMFLSGWHKFVHGQKAAAFWKDFTSHILLAAVGFYVAAPLFPATEGMAQIATYVLYGSVALAVWGKGYGSPWYLRPVFGVLGMVNMAIGLLSNGLSYLRILALGLVTGAMALAVDQVAVEMGKLFPSVIGIPVVIVIFIVGHVVSIALNTLGSFIHSGRLQFIEFFSQFFEGGGKPFSPFRRSFSSQ